MTTADFTAISNVVAGHHFVSDRVEVLRKMGYTVEECPMGSGGVLQVKEMKKETRIQIGYGKGKYNYAYAVILKKFTSNQNLILIPHDVQANRS